MITKEEFKTWLLKEALKGNTLIITCKIYQEIVSFLNCAETKIDTSEKECSNMDIIS